MITNTQYRKQKKAAKKMAEEHGAPPPIMKRLPKQQTTMQSKSQEKAAHYVMLARKALDSGDYDAAQNLCAKALKANPLNTVAQKYRDRIIQLQQYKGQYQKLEDEFLALLESVPSPRPLGFYTQYNKMIKELIRVGQNLVPYKEKVPAKWTLLHGHQL